MCVYFFLLIRSIYFITIFLVNNSITIIILYIVHSVELAQVFIVIASMRFANLLKTKQNWHLSLLLIGCVATIFILVKPPPPFYLELI